MAYCAQSDIATRINSEILARLADDSEAVVRSSADATTVLGTAAVQAKITQAIDDYAARMDLRLNGHLDTTDSANIAALTRINTTGAIYVLYLWRGHEKDTNPFYTQHLDNMEELDGIRKRMLHTQVSPETPGQYSVSNTAGQTKVFNSDDMAYMK